MNFRAARHEDLPAIVEMLADDRLGMQREDPSQMEPYESAFAAIENDPNNQLLVGEEEQILGVLQLTFVPGLTYQGGWRAQIEGVRVHSGARSQGIGGKLIRHAIELSVLRGCRMVQLTTDSTRPDALRFYESLGFVASHQGMKLHLE